MSEEKNEIAEVIQATCYGLFTEHVQQLQQADDLETILELMEVHRLREVINGSIKLQSHLLGQCYESVNENSSLTAVKYRREVSKLFKESFEKLDSRIDRFDEKLSRFRSSMRSWIAEHNDESVNGAFLGAAIGGLLLGPLGAIGGALLGGNGDSSASGEFEIEFRSLLNGYKGLMQDIENGLDECHEVTCECFVEVFQKSIGSETPTALLED